MVVYYTMTRNIMRVLNRVLRSDRVRIVLPFDKSHVRALARQVLLVVFVARGIVAIFFASDKRFVSVCIFAVFDMRIITRSRARASCVFVAVR